MNDSEELLSDLMLKRSMSRTVFGAENYKDRWLVLSPKTLCYYAGTLAVSIETAMALLSCLIIGKYS